MTETHVITDILLDKMRGMFDRDFHVLYFRLKNAELIGGKKLSDEIKSVLDQDENWLADHRYFSPTKKGILAIDKLFKKKIRSNTCFLTNADIDVILLKSKQLNRKINMMAIEGFTRAGEFSPREGYWLCEITKESNFFYIGTFVNLDFVDTVIFPKNTCRDLTQMEFQYFRNTNLYHINERDAFDLLNFHKHK